MPRKSQKVPSYCQHKASGQAVVRIGGHDHYLGPYGSPESHDEYARLIAEWRAGQASAAQESAAAAEMARFTITIAAAVQRYREFAEAYYVRDGKPTKELTEMKYALRPLRQLFGALPAKDFGPLALKAVRQHMVDAGWSRGVTNHRVDRIRRFFKWAVAEELVPPGSYEALRCVPGLRYGRTNARETEPVKPVPDAWVDAILPCLSPPASAMVQLQRLTGARPCEVVIMRACDIDMSAEVWLYEPYDHKNRWRGHRRIIPLGPKAQEIIKPFLTLKTDAFLFSPQEAEMWRSEQRRAARQSPMTPSQASRRPKPSPQRPKRERYDVDSYRRAITYAIKKTNAGRNVDDQVPHWYPLQLRHSRATEVRKGFGIEAAQVSLGHAHANVTEIYAEKNLDLAIHVARSIG